MLPILEILTFCLMAAYIPILNSRVLPPKAKRIAIYSSVACILVVVALWGLWTWQPTWIPKEYRQIAIFLCCDITFVISIAATLSAKGQK